ncbi:uncharacterized protein LOC124144635 [Haliotis rufescens]|uniref:uncharacterized protein LOC124144635 n=1 Tax=Haliotis rufescens TaxID=6454 RepID=UPI00201F9522|nr:uncharacterized protein LOC124144635 [Haliotis rufescens]XP_048245595.1 uncharacterized protein LOC124144635 [Haliotis rufescens]
MSGQSLQNVWTKSAECLDKVCRISGQSLQTLYTTVVQKLDTVSGPNPEQCDACWSRTLKSDGEFQCIDCYDVLCKPCSTGHQSSSATYSHKVVPLRDIREGIHCVRSPRCVSIPCLDHPGALYKYLCGSCMVPACDKCVLGQHTANTCTVHPLEKALEICKTNLEESKDIMDTVLSSLSSSVTHLDQRNTFLVKERDQSIQQLHQKAQSLVEQVLTEENKCVKKLNDLYNLQIGSVELESRDIKDKLCAVKDLKCLSEEVQEEGNSVQVTILSKSLTSCKEELRSFKTLPSLKRHKIFTVECSLLEKESIFLIPELKSNTESMCSPDTHCDRKTEQSDNEDHNVRSHSHLPAEETTDSASGEIISITASMAFTGGLGSAYLKQKYGIILEENGTIDGDASIEDTAEDPVLMDSKTVANVPTWPSHEYLMAKSNRRGMNYDHAGLYPPHEDSVLCLQPYPNSTNTPQIGFGNPNICGLSTLPVSLKPHQTICLSNHQNQAKTDVSALSVGDDHILVVDRDSRTVKMVDGSYKLKDTLYIDELSAHPHHSLAVISNHVVFVCGMYVHVTDQHLTLLRSFQLLQDQYQGETYLPLCKFSDKSFIIGNLPGSLLRIYNILGQLEAEVMSPLRGATVAIAQNNHGHLLFSSWEKGGLVLEVQKDLQVVRTYRPYGVPLWYPEDISVDHTGRVFVTDPVLNHIHGYNSVGIPLFMYSTANDGLLFPRCIVVKDDTCVVSGKHGNIILYKIIYVQLS